MQNIFYQSHSDSVWKTSSPWILSISSTTYKLQGQMPVHLVLKLGLANTSVKYSFIFLSLSSQLLTTVTIELATPRLRTKFSFIILNYQSVKVTNLNFFVIVKDYWRGFKLSISYFSYFLAGWTVVPAWLLVLLLLMVLLPTLWSGVVGTNSFSLGAEASSADTAKGDFIKFNGRLNFINADLIASLTLYGYPKLLISHIRNRISAWSYAQ